MSKSSVTLKSRIITPPALTLADITVVHEVTRDGVKTPGEKVSGADLLRLIELIQHVCPNWRMVLTDLDTVMTEMQWFSQLVEQAGGNDDSQIEGEQLCAVARALDWFAARICAASGSDEDMIRAAAGAYRVEIAPENQPAKMATGRETRRAGA